jgi:hypothetical protein
MFVIRLLAGLITLAVGAAVVTALAGVAPEDKVSAAKADRVDVAVSIPACAPEPWPYGCQWRESPVRRPASRSTSR